jgi:two-component system chemotaxis sensor kinase CheA
MDQTEMVGRFVLEAGDNVAVLERELVALQDAPRDPARCHRLFRAVHSVKGTAGFFGLTTITGLAHAVESILALVRDDRMEVTPALVHDLLAATDKLRVMVADPDHSAEILPEPVQSALKDRLRLEPAGGALRPAPAVPANLNAFALDAELIRSALRHGHHVYIIQLHLQADIEAAGQTPLHYLREVAELGTLIDTALDVAGVGGLDDASPSDLLCSILFATEMEPDLLLGAFGIPARQLTPVATEFFQEWITSQPRLVARQTAEAPAVAPAGLHPRPEEFVRLPVALVDAMLGLVSQLAGQRDELVRLAPARSGGALATVVGKLDAIATELQQTVAHARCQPAGTLFGRYPRIVYELGRKLGKEIHLETSGDDVEVARTVIEGLADPLAHLIRNSADHGIEPPDERLRLGKPANGVVRLHAESGAGGLRLEVRDDGRGLEVGRIATKALEKGLITAAQTETMTPDEIRRLIFAPGFSTATEITDISGRGYGMDVVRTNIEQLGGQVDLESEPGRGTVVIIRIPAHGALAKAESPGHSAEAA